MFSTSGGASHALFRSIKLQITISAALAIVFLLAAGIRAASPGARDFSFGSRGVSAYKAGNIYHYANAIVLQPDGKLISVGGIQRCEASSCNYDSLLVRFNANGTIDNTFGNNGAVVADYLNQNDELFAAALEPDGKIVAAGGGYFAPTSQTNVLGFKIMRFLPSGARDTSFGTNGIAYESFDDLGAAPESMFIQPDGKIVVAGTDNGSMLFIARFNPNGSLDASFGTNGKIVTNSYDVLKVKIARQSDGKIIVAGIKKGADAFKLIRFHSNGTLDTGYGSGGTVTSSIAHYYYYYPPAIALQPDDKLIVGASSNQPQSRVPTLKRFNADGSVDSSFAAERGEVLINNCMNCTEKPTKILLLPDGRFYVVGFNAGSTDFLPKALAITRYLSNGAIDKTFGFRGSSQFMPDNINNNGYYSTFFPAPLDAVLQPDGKVAFTGTSLGTTNESQVFVGRVTSTVTPPAVRGDFDGDRKTDFAVYRPSSSFWFVLNSSNGSLFAQKYGTAGDLLTPADYNHDMKTDLSVFRASQNYWVISTLTTPGTGATGINIFGQAADIRVPEDYDGDAQTDLAVFSPSSGDWKIRYSSRSLDTSYSINYDVTIHFGLGTDIPVPADYDGDGQADLAVFRPSNGYWFILRSSDGGFQAVNFGLGTDKLVPGDYDGDLKTDIAVFRDGFWYVLRSSDNGFYGIHWGLADDKPVPGDYDGDGKFDFAVFRATASGGAWYALQSSDSSFLGQYWGLNDDIPIPFTFVK
jgi:uncharacterized delta-60 repeat protein